MSKFSHIGCFVSSINLFLKRFKNVKIIKKKIFFSKINCHMILININGVTIELLQANKNSKLYKNKPHNIIDHAAFYCNSLDKQVLKLVNSGAKIILEKTYSPLFKSYFAFILLNGMLIEFIEKD
jgi:hypothetical protein